MTTDRNIYLGPYLEYRVRLAVTEVSACKFPDRCPRPVLQPFCSECGLKTPIETTHKEREEPAIELDTLLGEEMTEGLCVGMANHVIYRLIPNGLRPGARSCETHFDYSFSEHEDVDPENIAADKAWMLDAYAPEIEKLRKAGVDPVVKWGIMVWSS